MSIERILMENKDNGENNVMIDRSFRRRCLEKQILVCFGLIIDVLVNFLIDVKDEQAFLLIDNFIAQNVIPLIHDLYHHDYIYIFIDKQIEYSEEWTKQYRKIKGYLKNMIDICEQLRHDIKRLDENHASINILVSSFLQFSVNEIEPSFMFSVILKEILLENNYNTTIRKDFTDFCRQQYTENKTTLRIIDLFETNSENKLAIWWYTVPYFIYPMLNYALRNQDFEIILRMGFFV